MDAEKMCRYLVAKSVKNKIVKRGDGLGNSSLNFELFNILASEMKIFAL